MNWPNINIDKAFCQHSKKAGVGMVVRNYKGELVDEIGGKIKVDFVLSAEARLLKKG